MMLKKIGDKKKKKKMSQKSNVNQEEIVLLKKNSLKKMCYVLLCIFWSPCIFLVIFWPSRK